MKLQGEERDGRDGVETGQWGKGRRAGGGVGISGMMESGYAVRGAGVVGLLGNPKSRPETIDEVLEYDPDAFSGFEVGGSSAVLSDAVVRIGPVEMNGKTFRQRMDSVLKMYMVINTGHVRYIPEGLFNVLLDSLCMDIQSPWKGKGFKSFMYWRSMSNRSYKYSTIASYRHMLRKAGYLVKGNHYNPDLQFLRKAVATGAKLKFEIIV